MFQHGTVPHIVFNDENFERLVVLRYLDYIGLWINNVKTIKNDIPDLRKFTNLPLINYCGYASE